MKFSVLWLSSVSMFFPPEVAGLWCMWLPKQKQPQVNGTLPSAGKCRRRNVRTPPPPPPKLINEERQKPVSLIRIFPALGQTCKRPFPRWLDSSKTFLAHEFAISIVNLLWIHYYREFWTLFPRTCGIRENKEIKNHIRGLDLNPKFLLYRNHFFTLYHWRSRHRLSSKNICLSLP